MSSAIPLSQTPPISPHQPSSSSSYAAISSVDVSSLKRLAKKQELIEEWSNYKLKKIVSFINPIENGRIHRSVISKHNKENDCWIIYNNQVYDVTEYFLSKYEDYNNFLKINLSTIKDISKWERKIFLKKISPKDFFNLYNNILTIKKVFEFLEKDNTVKEYLRVFEPCILNISDFCDEISKFISSNLDLSLVKDLDQLKNFEINFINRGIDEDLDKKTTTLKDSELKLNSISDYLSKIIENKEKKSSGKTKDYVKIHETEKNNYSLVSTSRRCKLLLDALPSENTIIKLKYDETMNMSFDFKISKIVFFIFIIMIK
jgi:DNA mismatch repair ATPase MutS